MGEELILASRWDMPLDIGRFLWAVVFSGLPDWARYPLLAAVGAFAVHAVLGWLRTRFGGSPDEDLPLQENETRVR
ncbi:hypothetical protein [Streptomyces sp. NPDC058664]|uniref:hypothetical protein n=1 Tax=unclassified Streptomyces TaxID=2593676 RepID=UPI003654E2E2